MRSDIETDESLLRVFVLLMHEGREETRRGRKSVVYRRNVDNQIYDDNENLPDIKECILQARIGSGLPTATGLSYMKGNKCKLQTAAIYCYDFFNISESFLKLS